jgi:hypothetical protein
LTRFFMIISQPGCSLPSAESLPFTLQCAVLKGSTSESTLLSSNLFLCNNIKYSDHERNQTHLF